MSFKKAVLVITLALVSLLIVGHMVQKAIVKSDIGKFDISRPPDFLMYYTGAKLISEKAPNLLYNTPAQEKIQKQIVAPKKMEGLLAFRAPPLVALLLKPLANLTYTNAYHLLLVLNMALVVLILATYHKIKVIDKKVWRCLLFLLPLFLPIWSNLHGGQLSLFVLFFLALAYLLLTKNKLLQAGLMLGLLLLRPQFLTIIPMVIALFHKDKRIKDLLLGIFLSIATLTILNTYLYGIEFITSYPSFILSSESLAQGTNPFFNYNISSFLSLFIIDHQIINVLNIFINCVLYGLVLYLLIKNNSKTNRGLALAAVIMFGPLLNLHSMPVDLVVFQLPLYITVSYLYKKKEFKKAHMFAALILLLPWGAYLYLNFITTIIFILMGFWILRLSFGGDGGNRTPVLKT